jgi:hypothetical protein
MTIEKAEVEAILAEFAEQKKKKSAPPKKGAAKPKPGEIDPV